jgi:hypothetical protein
MPTKFLKTPLFLLLFSVFIVACGEGPNAWPGVTGVDEDNLVVAYKREVVRLDANEQRMWRYNGEDDTDFYTQPTVVDDVVFIGDYKGRVHAISYETGERLWMYEQDVTEFLIFSFGRRDRVLAPITMGDEFVFFGDEYGVNALERAGDEGEIVWEFETDHGVWSKPLYLTESTVVDDICADYIIDWESDWNLEPTLLFASLDKRMYALEPQTGEERWRLELDGAVAGNLTVDCLRQRVYVGTMNNQVLAIDIREGNIIDTFDTEGWVWGGPVIFEDSDDDERKLYVGDLSGYLYELTLDADGFSEETFQRRLSEEPLRASPLIVEEIDSGRPILVIGSEDRHVYAVPLNGAGWVADRERDIFWSEEFDGRTVSELTVLDRETEDGLTQRLVIVGSDDDDQMVIALDLGNGGDDAWVYEYDN